MKKRQALPKVSIITPSYNQAQYLEQTILSVLGQDYPNLEYIIMDGGSTDGSVEIIKKYADQLTCWVSEPDEGQADAINKGFRRATGEVVAWLNSDDVYLPGTIGKAVTHLQEYPDVGMVYGDLRSINALGEPINAIRYQQYDLKNLLSMQIIGQPTVFMRANILKRAGYLSLDYNFLLDHHLWLRMIQQAQIKYFPDEWAAARFHLSAKNVALAEGFGKEAFKILDWAKTQPDMAEIVEDNKKEILAGAYRFDAFYLLDGGHPWQALKAYWEVFIRKPLFALQQMQRIIFAIASILGFGWLRKIIKRNYYRE